MIPVIVVGSLVLLYTLLLVNQFARKPGVSRKYVLADDLPAPHGIVLVGVNNLPRVPLLDYPYPLVVVTVLYLVPVVKTSCRYGNLHREAFTGASCSGQPPPALGLLPRVFLIEVRERLLFQGAPCSASPAPPVFVFKEPVHPRCGCHPGVLARFVRLPCRTLLLIPQPIPLRPAGSEADRARGTLPLLWLFLK